MYATNLEYYMYVCPSTLDVFLYVVSCSPHHLDVGAHTNADDHTLGLWSHGIPSCAITTAQTAPLLPLISMGTGSPSLL